MSTRVTSCPGNASHSAHEKREARRGTRAVTSLSRALEKTIRQNTGPRIEETPGCPVFSMCLLAPAAPQHLSTEISVPVGHQDQNCRRSSWQRSPRLWIVLRCAHWDSG
ncbi:hypothetical protein NDU88_001066 [Pleurodeles waltl]|uniref:Uncharacterized protein n=1 Tax=Pleurodeles waltl TaxID=8319 RepID=A0AAV7SYX6_PLEWA|nr:hypothetical protein NDU88_000980 [Pleurodeles waltl]KAJ1169078.1 hypothetical protein NDU88_000984 [Pleurodeles waltl]KAJ1169081.1 hypothetical protein NDU88_000987 [Pleurodeles waltl]KAJ1169160.1 hypothetical protein NDU88_001066 [Pleurodeles waltl]